ncbi:MAG: hypothetical protein M5U31_03345 [Acidimicrobiia bacterium]|nr:hypothetical protein [Acidimicrobiia bacterium]
MLSRMLPPVLRRHWCKAVQALTLGVLAVLAFATPASAQQLVDASEDGDVAFILFAVMCFLFVGGLFLMDRVRRKRLEDDDIENQ